MKTKLFLDKPQLQDNNTFKGFQKQIKMSHYMVKVSRFTNPYLKSPEYFTKAVCGLPKFLRQIFYKYTRKIVSCEKFVSLEQF